MEAIPLAEGAAGLSSAGDAQVLGRNLEALITRGGGHQGQVKDDFTSVEHLVLAFEDDTRFGRRAAARRGPGRQKLEEAVKDIRGSNRVTDQVPALTTWQAHATAV